MAIFEVTKGSPVFILLKKPRFTSRAAFSSKPTFTSMPLSLRSLTPLPETSGLESSVATNTLDTLAFMSA